MLAHLAVRAKVELDTPSHLFSLLPVHKLIEVQPYFSYKCHRAMKSALRPWLSIW